MRSEVEVHRAIDQYADTVKRICVLHLRNYADTEDIFQTVFLKYAISKVQFESAEHEKAWIIRVTLNACKDLLRSFFRNPALTHQEIIDLAGSVDPAHSDVLEAVLNLPEKYKRVIYLHYYEGYTAPEIGKILGKNVNTVYTLLTRGREMLKKTLGGDEDEP